MGHARFSVRMNQIKSNQVFYPPIPTYPLSLTSVQRAYLTFEIQRLLHSHTPDQAGFLRSYNNENF
jgi:hypothetical protein